MKSVLHSNAGDYIIIIWWQVVRRRRRRRAAALRPAWGFGRSRDAGSPLVVAHAQPRRAGRGRGGLHGGRGPGCDGPRPRHHRRGRGQVDVELDVVRARARARERGALAPAVVLRGPARRAAARRLARRRGELGEARAERRGLAIDERARRAEVDGEGGRGRLGG